MDSIKDEHARTSLDISDIVRRYGGQSSSMISWTKELDDIEHGRRVNPLEPIDGAPSYLQDAKSESNQSFGQQNVANRILEEQAHEDAY